ncbi:hypothetical protein ABH15_04815 [Methanoculleus taiwanensis]|uniref:Uncharacterized protein n=1 Tax=Methanoculleus taiwanensis TaxID=1550565 RepID=A0A498GXW3_9EURY|nr:hypothetical protein [Methanoculleus taiwanensis]RXE55591.1 hypothetical protein ABH15_04815 [Methanoculleus taiwanensis]
MDDQNYPPGFDDALSFPLVQALFGRRARRFPRGGAIPDGYFRYSSGHEAMPLSPLEQMLVLTAAAGNSGWQNLIMRNARYAPHLANYACSAGGRTFPSAAGFHTSEIFYTDDDGVYFLETRDAPALAGTSGDGRIEPEELLAAHRSRITKIADGRLKLPAEVPYVEGHNTWVANHPGSTLIIPVGDLAQHTLAALCYYLQNGQCIYDDRNGEQIGGMEQYRHLCDVDNPLPLTFLEQTSLAELTAELSTACYAGMLMLQATGLGGWMYDGIDPYSILGASGNPAVPGLGFRYDTDERWSLPNPTGLPGIFEGYTPPHYRDMRSALDALVQRKFGPGGPFHPETGGPYKMTAHVRGSARKFDEEFLDCVALQAQYIYDRFGKFPGTVPSIFVLTYLQAQHIDTTFYDRFYLPGAYLPTHARHMENWHSGSKE